MGHCSTDRSSWARGRPRKPRPQPHLPREGWWGRSYQLPPEPETRDPVPQRSHGCGWWALESRPLYSVSLATAQPVSLLPPLLCPHQLPPTLSLCLQAIDSSHSISIDLFLSPSFFTFLSSIDPPDLSLPFNQIALYRQISPSPPALIHDTHSKSSQPLGQ